jgi:cell division septation protein DedD
MAEENVHEIQLNGKQLVFLFMTTVAAVVVIFLCGVMVGQRLGMVSAVAIAERGDDADLDPTAWQSPAPEPSETADSTLPDTAPFEPSFPRRLDAEEPVRETVAVPNATRAARVTQTSAESARPAARTPDAVPAPVRQTGTSVAQPNGDGFAVQVAAVGARAEADAIAKRLADKGFPSFVTSPGSGAARLFRVRVGKYQDRAEAETVARRLEQEEQYKPWITR